MNYQLKKVTNELTKGTAMFSYDQFNNLVCVKETGFETIFRTTDCVGNLYETQDNSDRIYGAGSRLEKSGIDLKEKRNSFQGGHGRLVTKGREYFYDEEGNLAKRVEPNGDTWSYLYFGNGMLRKIIRPDKSGVSFKYDPFGRRIEKAVTKAGSEDVSKLEGRMPSIEEGTWETVGGVRIRKPNTEMKKPHVVKGIDQSVYEEESCKPKEPQEKAENIEKVIRFLWDGNTLLHEWEEENPANRMTPKSKVDYKADYLLKLEKQEEEKAGKEAERGQRPPDGLVTWVFQDDFIPRGKITKDGNYSIISDYLGTPVEAYDEEGKKVWERELDIYGRVKTGRKDAYGRSEKETGEKNFIPFRFQGQYEDEETGLYYNRFRYYSPEDGGYTQQDPIGLAGGNLTLYGYVFDILCEIDPFGLANLFEVGTYGSLNGGANVGDGLTAHELIRHESLVRKGFTSKGVRLSGNPSVALDNLHHTRVGGAHWWEAKIRKKYYNLGRNQFHSNLKRELDITQGGLRKAGYPASQARKLRKESEKFYKKLAKKGCRG